MDQANRPVADNVVAVARCVQGKGLIKVNGKPVKLFGSEILRAKLYEPVLILGVDKFAEVDIRVRVTGGGHTSQIYAVRQAVRFSRCPAKTEIWNERTLTRMRNRLPRALSVPEPDAPRDAPLRRWNANTEPQVAYYAKFIDEHSKNLLKAALIQFDRSLLVADPRRCEPKKFGGKGARSRFQKSYR